MSEREHCQHPDACVAKGYGHCCSCARLRLLHHNAEFRKATSERLRAAVLRTNCRRTANFLAGLGVPEDGVEAYRLARKHRFSKDEALAIARRHVASRGRLQFSRIEPEA
jgi:hypothetical protein